MPDERADSDEQGPIGYGVDKTRGGGESPDYVGIRDHGAPSEGERLSRGDKVRVLFWVKGEEGWWVAEDGSRIWSEGAVEKP